MNDPRVTPERSPGQTGGSAQRPPHELSGTVTVLDLLDEADALRREPAWAQSDRNAKTFVKGSDLRVLLTILKQDAIIREHRVPATVVVQVLTGRVRLRLPDQEVELPAGRMVILERDLPHDVEALEESAFVISIGWSVGPRGDVR